MLATHGFLKAVLSILSIYRKIEVMLTWQTKGKVVMAANTELGSIRPKDRGRVLVWPASEGVPVSTGA